MQPHTLWVKRDAGEATPAKESLYRIVKHKNFDTNQPKCAQVSFEPRVFLCAQKATPECRNIRDPSIPSRLILERKKSPHGLFCVQWWR